MDIDKLVEIVTKEVVKRLKAIDEPIETEISDKVLILDSISNLKHAALINELKKSKLEAVGIEAWDQEVNLETYKFVIAPVLGIREIANIALGVSCGPVCQTVINSILTGKEVYVLEEGIEYRCFKDTANKLLYSRLQDYEKQLVSYGVKIVSKSELFKGPVEEEKTDIRTAEIKECTTIDVYNVDKKLITEADIQKLHRQGCKRISIGLKSIMTPSAADAVKVYNMEIIKG